MKFYTAKVICIDLGISRTTLNRREKIGTYPKFEQSPHRENGVGYSSNTFDDVKKIICPIAGRPKKSL